MPIEKNDRSRMKRNEAAGRSCTSQPWQPSNGFNRAKAISRHLDCFIEVPIVTGWEVPLSRSVTWSLVKALIEALT